MAKETRHVDIRVTSNVGTQMTKGTAAATGLSGALKGVVASASMATGGIRAMTMALISSGVGAIVVAVGALAAGFMKLANVSKDFAFSLSNLQAISGGTSEDMTALKDNALELGRTTSFTASEVVKLQTELAKLGFSTSEILASSAATLNLAKVASVDLGEAAAVAGATLRGFGLDADQSGRVVDVMAKSFSSSGLDMAKFSESMKLVAPIAATVKVPIEQATAALGILADRGVSGSLAGTQLRRVLSDLAMTTGVSFRDSLDIAAERMDKAKSSSEKLAIATEMVGDRAKGSLIALVENREALDSLTVKLDDAAGASAEMARIMDDNLKGDLMKLSSAWEGFMLGLESGEGIISQISRGAIQLLTTGISKLQIISREFGYYWEGTMTGINNSINNTSKIFRGGWGAMTSYLEIASTKMKMAISDVPLLGDGLDKEKLAEELKEYEKNLKHYVALTEEGWSATNNVQLHIANARLRGEAEVKAQMEVKAALKQIQEDFLEGEGESDDAAADKRKKKRLDFLAKLKKQEEDFLASDSYKKVELARNRHLAELSELEISTTEKKELEARINAQYDAQKEALDAEAREKKKLQDTKDAEDAAKAAEEASREAKRLHDEKLQMQMEAFANAAEIAGRETALGKALLMVKQVMLLKEILMNGKATIAKVKLKASEAAVDFEAGKTKTLASAPFPWNLGLLGGFIVSALPSIIAMRSAMKNVKGSGGGSLSVNTSIPSSGGSTPQIQAPSFNVLGRTSAGENMLAGAIGNANQRPVKAFVVEQEITSAQSMARNAAVSASIG